ncbi:MAG: AAA family ATPase [Phycisphaera sp.]|nr:AAA family ATPase [Phycisphaera sp.]
MVILLMGVSGCGKTTIGRTLASRLGWVFEDADDYHPPANVEKMRRGEPLTEADRVPWLDALAALIRERNAAGRNTVLACSALTRAARVRLGAHAEFVQLVHLAGSFELIAARLRERQHEYMPDTLLRSQFDTLEPPGDDERVLIVNIARPVDDIVETIVQVLRQ